MLSIGSAGHLIRHTQQVQQAMEQVTAATTRLATHQRLNHGSDDPSGLIAAEQLRSELRVVEAESRAASDDSTRRVLEDREVQLQQSLSKIVDVDVAVESANLVRAMILSDTAIATTRLALDTFQSQASLLDELFAAVP